MKQYKLIRIFRESPPLNSYTNINTKNNSCIVYKPNGEVFSDSYGWKWIEDYPEFWEEIISKDYEILELRATGKLDQSSPSRKLNNDTFLYHLHNSIYSRECTLDHLLNSGYSIYSVKRLSDNEVFSIGDKCIQGTLTQIQLDSVVKGLWLDFENPSHGGYFNINIIQKAKVKLFTTFDSVDIYEDDEYYRIGTELLIFSTPSKYRASSNNSYPDQKYPDYHINFSTKEAAEDYILMYKPCLSINDIKNLKIGMDFKEQVSLVNNLKTLLKSKL